MKIVRYQKEQIIGYGELNDDLIYPINGNLFGDHTISSTGIPLEDVKLLAPVEPRQLFAIGLNYKDHVGELRFADELPTEPISFLLASSAIIGPEEEITLDSSHCRIDEEAELVAVIGKRCEKVSKENALDYVFGYTCGNDISNRDLQAQDKQWLRAKSFPGYKPMGPCIVTDLDPSNLNITCTVNGEIKQQSNTKHLLFDVAELIAFLSSYTILEPGDVIMTGTPQGVTPLKSNDVIEVSIEGIGVLKNIVH